MFTSNNSTSYVTDWLTGLQVHGICTTPERSDQTARQYRTVRHAVRQLGNLQLLLSV